MGLATLSDHSCRSSTMHTPRHIWTKMGSVGNSHYQTTCSHTKQREAARRQPTADWWISQCMDWFWLDLMRKGWDLRRVMKLRDNVLTYKTKKSTQETANNTDWWSFPVYRLILFRLDEKGFGTEKIYEICNCLWQSLIVLMWPCVVNWALVSSY